MYVWKLKPIVGLTKSDSLKKTAGVVFSGKIILLILSSSSRLLQLKRLINVLVITYYFFYKCPYTQSQAFVHQKVLTEGIIFIKAYNFNYRF